MDLSTRYMGLDLANPVVVSSSGLTQSIEGIRQCAAAGAGAVVLKSIFEEQIQAEIEGLMAESEDSLWHPEAADYIRNYGRENAVKAYLDLIREAKQAVSIPIIASVHCTTAGTWTEFARRAEQAGADALELNVFVLPSDPRRNGPQNEQVYFDVLKAVKGKAEIPVALKIGAYFSGLSETVQRLSRSGADALVLFNRFYQMDFDIEQLRLVPASVLSTPEEIAIPLRWISILSGQVACDLAATTGVHDGAGIVKQLLAGATAVQICSALYKHEIPYLETMIRELEGWMERHDYHSIADFRGKLRQDASENPAAYLRVQFMKHSVGIE